ncbi:MAG: molybdopterin-dependent oxidoreductase [Nitrospinae bacterium]|nr:molybdopterin-dependent oxidoreductase [Nitrospinota bacterium]MBL7021305.1 molybdopterin-dependent oxidoreductase [Nitrospinaceae bacterium]
MRQIGKLTRRLFIKGGLWTATLFLWNLFRGTTKAWAQEIDSFSGTDFVGKTREGKHRSFYINYWKPMRRINAETWALKISGLCESPTTFTLTELKNLPTQSQSSRLKCVECWSARAEWRGFSIKELEQVVRPHASAQGVVFHCGDEYKEYLSREALNKDRVLLVHSMNGQPLSDAHGFPLRLIAPSKYGYKNPKAILEMEYVAEQQAGTWSKIGPYSPDGTILPGWDHPLEYDKQARRISGGEIPY